MEYTDFVVNLPEKCMAILMENAEKDINKDREVTHMLALAMASIIVPYERLQQSHPSGDRKLYNAQALNRIQNQQMSSTKVLWDEGMRSWVYGTTDARFDKLVDTIRQGMNVDEVIHRQNVGSCEIKVIEFLGIIRNALAHGNIFFGGGAEEGSQIEQLVFLSKDRKKVDRGLRDELKKAMLENSGDDARALKIAIDSAKVDKGYKMLFVHPEDFEMFLSKWVTFLQDEIRIPEMRDAA